MREYTLLALLIFTSCTSFKPVEPFKVSKFNYNKSGLFFGNIDLNYNKTQNSGECNAKFSHEQKSFLVNIAKNGNIKALAPAGEIKLSSVQCGKHQYTFKNPYAFNNTIGRRKTFIGHIKLDWTLGAKKDWIRATSRVFGLSEYASSEDKMIIQNSSLKNRKLASDMLLHINLLKP